MPKNSMAFHDRESANALLTVLLDYNQKNLDEYHYNDIHIYQEEDLIVIEWDQVPYNHEYGGAFKYVDEDEEVLKRVWFPDNSMGYASTEAEKEEMLKEWKESHSDE